MLVLFKRGILGLVTSCNRNMSYSSNRATKKKKKNTEALSTALCYIETQSKKANYHNHKSRSKNLAENSFCDN